MSVIMYLDTQKITKKLVASGLTESQAESITDVARDITANNLEHLASCLIDSFLVFFFDEDCKHVASSKRLPFPS